MNVLQLRERLNTVEAYGDAPHMRHIVQAALTEMRGSDGFGDIEALAGGRLSIEALGAMIQQLAVSGMRAAAVEAMPLPELFAALTVKATGDADWPTVTEAAREQGITASMITKAVNKGQLASNGKSGRHRRINPASLIKWNLARANPDGIL